MPFRPDEMWPLSDEDSKPFRAMLSTLDRIVDEQSKKGLGRKAGTPIVFKLTDFQADMSTHRAREALRLFVNKGWKVKLGINHVELYDALSDICEWGTT